MSIWEDSQGYKNHMPVCSMIFHCHALIWHERFISPQRGALASGIRVDAQQVSVAAIRIHNFVLWCLWENQNDIVCVCGPCFCAPDHKDQSDTREWLCEGQHQHSDQSAEALWELLGHHGQHQEGDLQSGSPAPAEGLWSRTQQQSPGRPCTVTGIPMDKRPCMHTYPRLLTFLPHRKPLRFVLDSSAAQKTKLSVNIIPLAWFQIVLILPRTKTESNHRSHSTTTV